MLMSEVNVGNPRGLIESPFGSVGERKAGPLCLPSRRCCFGGGGWEAGEGGEWTEESST